MLEIIEEITMRGLNTIETTLALVEHIDLEVEFDHEIGLDPRLLGAGEAEIAHA